MERNLFQELKVGCFLLVLAAGVLVAIYILGGASKMFADEYVLRTTFQDVKGLKAGAVVRLAGIDVGQVSQVNFATDAGVKEIQVELTIRSEYQPRLRGDSVATISQVGLLGDMLITLSVGSPAQPALEDGEHIQSAESVDIMSYAGRATAIVENAANISRKVDLMLGTDEEASQAQIAGSLAKVEELLTDAKSGKGALGVLLYEEKSADRVRGILANVEGITADVKSITGEVRSGEGLANALVYGDEGAKLTTQLGSVADALTALLADVRNEESLVHALLYEPDNAKMVSDLQGTLANVRLMTEAVNSGDGTLGLLVNDPQLYEDVRALMGGAQRNALLRAYVRATVAQGKEQTASGWTAPDPR